MNMSRMLLLLTLAFAFVSPTYKSTKDFFVLVLVALSCYCCRSSLLRNGIAVYELWFFQVIFQKNFQEKIRWICHSLRHQKIFSLCLSNSPFGWWNWINLKIKNSRKPNSMPFLAFRPEIICGPNRGSFAVQLGDHLRSGDHLWSGIIGIWEFFLYISSRLLSPLQVLWCLILRTSNFAHRSKVADNTAVLIRSSV